MNIQKSLSCAVLMVVTAICSHAQQFIGLQSKDYAAIQQMPYNPAWVNMAESGTEFNAFGLSIVAGTNAYLVKKSWIFGGSYSNAVENVDYYRDLTKRKKHIWTNIDLLGPAISFNYKDIHNIGVYTRFREIVRGGNLTETEFKLMGKMEDRYFYVPLNFKNTGVSAQSFAEVGFTYGRVLRNDYYHIFRAGGTVKYLMGFAAANVYTHSTEYVQSAADSLLRVEGDVTGLFTYNTNPINGDKSFNPAALLERAGRGSLGLDIGVQYEYHPTGNPNEETPYSYNISASITDIGGITYIADTGSGSYKLNIAKEAIDDFNLRDGESFGWYTSRLVRDSILIPTHQAKKFRMSLPTAFRFNIDYNATKKLNIAGNVLLNLKGNNGEIYRPGYVSYINVTPTYGSRKYKLSMPLTFIGYQTVTLGAIVQAGPFYMGSNTLFSTLLSKNFKNLDFFMGLAFKARKDRHYYY